MYSKSGRIRSTPGWWSSGNSTPQSMMSSWPPVLEDGHVAADLAEAAERDDAQAAVGERAGQVELGVRVAHRVGSVARADAEQLEVLRRRLDQRQAHGRRLDDAELDERGLGHDRPLGGGHDARRRRG